MNNFDNLLNSDYGFNPQGKFAPMSARSSSTRTTPSSFSYANFINDNDPIFNPPRYSSTPDNTRGYDFENVFSGVGGVKEDVKVVFNKPVFDEDENLFGGDVKGTGLGNFENVFASMENGSVFDDYLGSGGVGGGVKKDDGVSVEKVGGDFDDLILGFGGSSPATARHATSSATKTFSLVKEDPFSGIDSPLAHEGQDSGTFTDPLKESGKAGKNGNIRKDESPIGVSDDMNPFESHIKEKPSKNGSNSSGRHMFFNEKSPENINVDSRGSSRKKAAQNSLSDSYQSMFGMPSSTKNSHFSDRAVSPPPYEESVARGINSPSTATHHNTNASDDIWLTVSEIPLFTQPTSAPPPSRPPPPRPTRVRKTEARTPSPRTNVPNIPPSYNSTQNRQSFMSDSADVRSSIDELDDFSKGKAYARSHAHTDVFDENLQAQSDAAASAAVMKEVMNRAEAKFKHAKELKEKENARAFRNRENNTLNDDGEIPHSGINRKEEEDLEKQKFEQERMRAKELEREKEREEKERERVRLERKRERAREEREKDRQAVERATREARERAALDARLRVEKANSEARERAQRLAVQRAQAEARQRAQVEARERAEAKERAEKDAAEAKEKTAKTENDARIRAERAAVDRAAREVRERAASQARERAAAQARERASTARVNQQNAEDDLESFFGSGSRPSSAPGASANNSDSFINSQFQPNQGTGDVRRTSSSFSNIRKTSSSTNIVDDLSSIFGGSPQSGSFQEMEGETEERRRARLERDQRTNERAAKALAEKNERDLQAQREQAERHKFSETIDSEIRRWAAGKEGNIRALLSTMQYILWPECGWQPVSLTDLITGASVKKAYRKATLCIHPDKVQQKGANVQQKCIAEKVFDLLKEAWNKFNSEELY